MAAFWQLVSADIAAMVTQYRMYLPFIGLLVWPTPGLSVCEPASARVSNTGAGRCWLGLCSDLADVIANVDADTLDVLQ